MMSTNETFIQNKHIITIKFQGNNFKCHVPKVIRCLLLPPSGQFTCTATEALASHVTHIYTYLYTRGTLTFGLPEIKGNLLCYVTLYNYCLYITTLQVEVTLHGG